MGESTESIFCKLENLEAPPIESSSRGVKLSKITAKLKDTIDIVPLLGKFQQMGLVRIVYDPSVDEEPLIKITEKSRQQAMEMLLSW